jgi:NDP-sugar pyrophosphorylase family protein
MKISDCDCVILCGGFGKRLRGVVSDVPKVMAEVDGRPFLDLLIEYLKSQCIERVVLCTGYKAELIEGYYRTRDLGVTIDFSTEHKPLGTGGALKNAREIISSESFFVCNGDSLLSADLKAFFDFHKDKKSLASIVVSQVDNGKDFGSIGLDAGGRIIAFEEKSKDASGQLVNAGIYCFNQGVFSRMPDKDVFSLETDLFPSLLNDRLYGYKIDKEFMDIGTPERYKSAKKKLRKG